MLIVGFFFNDRLDKFCVVDFFCSLLFGFLVLIKWFILVNIIYGSEQKMRERYISPEFRCIYSTPEAISAEIVTDLPLLYESETLIASICFGFSGFLFSLASFFLSLILFRNQVFWFIFYLLLQSLAQRLSSVKDYAYKYSVSNSTSNVFQRTHVYNSFLDLHKSWYSRCLV